MNFIRIATDLLVNQSPSAISVIYDEIRQLIDAFDVIKLIDDVRPIHKRGKPHISNELLLKMYIVQVMNSYTDPQLEREIKKNIELWKFLDINPLNDRIPDETTICRFRNLLMKNRVQVRIFQLINNNLKKLGLLTSDISLLDATVVEAQKSTKNSRLGRDPYMDSTFKNKCRYFGFKIHINASETAIVRKIICTRAHVHDSSIAESLLTGEESYAYGDSGYSSKVRAARYLSEGIIPMFCEKGYRGHPLTEEQRENNRNKSSIRAKVEHPFGKIKDMFKFRKTRYKGLYRNFIHVHMAFSLSNLVTIRKRALEILKD